MSEPLILPDSRAKDVKGLIIGPKGWEQPIYCASCGVLAGSCPEEATFLFYVCDACFATYKPVLEGVAYMPDEVFFQKVEEAQVEKYGRTLNAVETVISLGDPESLESKLARDRKFLTPKASE